jgi:lipoate-protein ligase A
MDIKIIPFSVGEPERNMETDTEITLRAEKEGKVILRWYGWKKLSLSFGYSQKKLLKEYETNLPKVLRPTGGGILLHGWDISYAIGTPSGLFRSHLHLYRFVSETFIETFKSLGLHNVTYSRSKKGDYRRWKLCSLFPTFGEVCLNNRKLIASAVREFSKGNFLIHGSIYIAFNYRLGSEVLKVPEVVLRNSIATLSELGLKKKQLMELFNKTFKNRFLLSGID